MVGVYSQLLEREYSGQLNKDAQEYLGYVVQGAKRMEMLVEDLLTYTQAVIMPASDPPPVNASTVLERTLGHLQGALQQAGARVEREALPTLFVQEVHLLQLLQN